MIVADIRDAALYRGIHPRLDRVLGLLDEEHLAAIGTDVLKIEGDEIFAQRFHLQTVPFDETFFEAHARYADVQLVVEGCEQMDIAPAYTLEQYEHRGDFYALRGEKKQSIVLTPGQFAIFLPGDAHRLKIAVGEPAPVTRVLFKVLMNE